MLVIVLINRHLCINVPKLYLVSVIKMNVFEWYFYVKTNLVLQFDIPDIKSSHICIYTGCSGNEVILLKYVYRTHGNKQKSFIRRCFS